MDTVNKNMKNFIQDIYINLCEDINKYKNTQFLGVYIYKFAKELNLEIIKSGKYLYIKKGQRPKLLLNYEIEDFDLSNIKKNVLISLEHERIDSFIGYGIHTVSTVIVLLRLMKYAEVSFEILLIFNDKRHNIKSFDFNVIESKRVLNLNNREKDLLADGSLLKVNYNVYIPYVRELTDKQCEQFSLSLENLTEANYFDTVSKIGQNPIKLLFSAIRKIRQAVDIELVNIQREKNGAKDLKATILVEDNFTQELKTSFDIVISEIMERNLRNEPDLHFELDKIKCDQKSYITKSDFERINSFIELIPCGVYSTDSKKTVESSLNISDIKSYDKFIKVTLDALSNDENKTEEIHKKIALAANVAKSSFEINSKSPKWINTSQEFKKLSKESYETIYGKEPIISCLNNLPKVLSDLSFHNKDILSVGIDVKKNFSEELVYEDDILNLYFYILQIMSAFGKKGYK